MRSTVPTVSIVAVAVAVLAAACATPRVSHDEYVSRLDRLCRAYRPQAERLADRAVAGPTELSHVLAEGIRLGREALDELTAVRPPREDEAAVAAILDPAREALDDLEDARDAGERGASQIMTALASRAGERLLAASEAAVTYGAASCATSG